MCPSWTYIFLQVKYVKLSSALYLWFSNTYSLKDLHHFVVADGWRIDEGVYVQFTNKEEYVVNVVVIQPLALLAEHSDTHVNEVWTGVLLNYTNEEKIHLVIPRIKCDDKPYTTV